MGQTPKSWDPEQNNIKNMYSEVKSSVVLNDRMTEWFDIEIGLRQGCVLTALVPDIH